MLNKFFGPAMLAMSRLNFSVKIGLIGALFMLPIFAMGYFLYGKFTADIAFAQSERNGLAQIIPARGVLQSLQAHRGTSQIFLNGDASAKDRLVGLAEQVDKKMEALEQADKSFGVELKTNDVFANLKKSWLNLKTKNLALTGA